MEIINQDLRVNDNHKYTRGGDKFANSCTLARAIHISKKINRLLGRP